MILSRAREAWRRRRLELAMEQLNAPTERPDDDGMVNPTPMGVRAERAQLGALGRLTRATSRTEWRGD